MSKILFIYEGAKAEKKFCKLIIDKYFNVKNKKKEYVAFCANIYSLYDELSKDYGLNIAELLVERARKSGKKSEYEKLQSGGFAEIYLIFDFDPQAPQYEDVKIKKMVKFFNDETENGKLYINYPSIESFKHFVSIPDVNYVNYTVRIKDCSKYKEYINSISKIKYYGLVSNEQLNNIIRQNLEKYSVISNKDISSYKKYRLNFSQYKLLRLQLMKKNKDNSIYVFNTGVFWGIDYFGEKVYSDYFDNALNKVGV